MYITIYEIDHQSRFNAWDRVFRAGALRRPWWMGWGGSWEGDSGQGTHVHPWPIHVNVWQKWLQYYKVISLQLKNNNNKNIVYNIERQMLYSNWKVHSIGPIWFQLLFFISCFSQSLCHFFRFVPPPLPSCLRNMLLINW